MPRRAPAAPTNQAPGSPRGKLPPVPLTQQQQQLPILLAGRQPRAPKDMEQERAVPPARMQAGVGASAAGGGAWWHVQAPEPQGAPDSGGGAKGGARQMEQVSLCSLPAALSWHLLQTWRSPLSAAASSPCIGLPRDWEENRQVTPPPPAPRKHLPITCITAELGFSKPQPPGSLSRQRSPHHNSVHHLHWVWFLLSCPLQGPPGEQELKAGAEAPWGTQVMRGRRMSHPQCTAGLGWRNSDRNPFLAVPREDQPPGGPRSRGLLRARARALLRRGQQRDAEGGTPRGYTA